MRLTVAGQSLLPRKFPQVVNSMNLVFADQRIVFKTQNGPFLEFDLIPSGSQPIECCIV
jgi:hypothetical protein